MWNQVSAVSSARKVNARKDNGRGSVESARNSADNARNVGDNARNSAGNARNNVRDKNNKKSENNLREHDCRQKKPDQMNLGQNRNQRERDKITTNNRNQVNTENGGKVLGSARGISDSARNVVKKSENGTRNRSEMYRRPE